MPRKTNLLLYITKLHLLDVVIYIFKISDKFPGPKHPFRGQNGGKTRYFGNICPQMCPKCRCILVGCALQHIIALKVFEIIGLLSHFRHGHLLRQLPKLHIKRNGKILLKYTMTSYAALYLTNFEKQKVQLSCEIFNEKLLQHSQLVVPPPQKVVPAFCRSGKEVGYF